MEPKKIGAREILTAAICGAILIDTLVYWIIQINGVREVLKMAAGG